MKSTSQRLKEVIAEAIQAHEEQHLVDLLALCHDPKCVLLNEIAALKAQTCQHKHLSSDKEDPDIIAANETIKALKARLEASEGRIEWLSNNWNEVQPHNRRDWKWFDGDKTQFFETFQEALNTAYQSSKRENK